MIGLSIVAVVRGPCPALILQSRLLFNHEQGAGDAHSLEATWLARGRLT